MWHNWIFWCGSNFVFSDPRLGPQHCPAVLLCFSRSSRHFHNHNFMSSSQSFGLPTLLSPEKKLGQGNWRIEFAPVLSFHIYYNGAHAPPPTSTHALDLIPFYVSRGHSFRYTFSKFSTSCSHLDSSLQHSNMFESYITNKAKQTKCPLTPPIPQVPICSIHPPVMAQLFKCYA